MIKLNEEIKIIEAQHNRLFITSAELGYGQWIYNYELTEMIKNKSKNKEAE